eukprot:TRINITY_DN10_c0_g1_i1.p1 TRINITY_DN10_c0_g1~~TRINITY_DN10_c0_g1_i1.p1  ORF type:complete len:321 (+),score=82.45 TRINITY_DN10_c0_g1_i1:43-963(+)
MARLFKKLFSQTSDLLNKEYPEEAGTDFSLELNKTFKAVGGTDLKLGVTKPATGTAVKVVIEPSGKVPEKNIDIAAKFSTEGKHEGTITLTNLLDNRAKVTVKEAFKGAFNNYSVEVGGEFVDQNVAVNGTVNFSGENLIGTVAAKGAIVLVKDSLAAGAEVSVEKENDSDLVVKSTSVKVEVKGNTNVASFESVFSKNQYVKLGYHQKVNNKLQGAADFKISPSDDALNSEARLGFINAINDTTTLRTRLTVNNTSTSRVAFVYTQKYQNNFELALGANLNTNQLFGASVDAKDAHQFKVQLSLD